MQKTKCYGNQWENINIHWCKAIHEKLKARSGQNQPPNHHHSDGHYWFCPKLTRVLVSLGKFFPLFKDRILGKIFWNIPGNLSAKKWIYLLYNLPCCINLINVVMALTKPTSDFVWNIWPRHFFFCWGKLETFLI